MNKVKGMRIKMSDRIEKFIGNYEVFHHKSGLDIIFYEQDADAFSVYLSVGAGSVNGQGINNFWQYGTAHFLEHLLFDSENKNTSLFANTGAMANAYTDYDKTVYFVSGYGELEENLNIMLKTIMNHNFGSIDLEKNSAIISSEIMMYKEDITTKLDRLFFRALFDLHPAQVDIAGTDESIRKITIDSILLFYHTFYIANKMCIVIMGKYTKEKIIEIINEYFDQSIIQPNNNLLKHPQYYESELKQLTEKSDESYNFFLMGYCYRNKEFEIHNKFANEILLELLVMKLNKQYGFAEEDYLETDVLYVENYYICYCKGILKNENYVYDNIIEIIFDLRDNKIEPEEFDLAQKKIYAKYVRFLANKNNLFLLLKESFLSDIQLFDVFRIIRELSKEDIARFIRKMKIDKRIKIAVL